MLVRDSDTEWELLGQNDPFYGVLSHDRFRKEKLDETSRREFFQSGREHIDFLLQTLRESVDPEFTPTNALDFGCGIGRCAIPLAQVCREVVGVDVSDAMLEKARTIGQEQSISNLRLLRSDDGLTSVAGPFDFVHAFLVFQHIHPSRGEKIFARLVQLLSDRGVGVAQFVYYREESAAIGILSQLRRRIPGLHNFVNLLYGKPFSEPLMEKNVYDLNRLLAVLHRHGCGRLHIKCFGDPKLRSAILFFKKQKDRVPYDES